MVRIGLATDSMEFTPTPAYKADNGYDYSFENGNPFSDVIEEGSFSVSQGFSYGSDARTTTFKCSMSGTMAQMKAIEQYSHIAVYKDGALVFCGCNPTFSKKIPRGVGRDGKGESFVEASVTYEDYSAGFKDVAFSTDESFDLFYSSNDAIKVCDPDNPSKSLVHILFGYLDRNKAFSLHFGAMPSILKTTVVTYFSASYNDKVLSMLSDVFKQAGLAWYVSNRDIYVLDVLETLSGTAVNIPDIESGATKKGRSYVKLEIPEIRIATARIAEDMVVYDSGTMTLDGKDWAWSDPVYYPSKEKYVEASFSCARKEDGAKNGKDSDEREKRYFNFRDRNFYGNTGSVFGDSYGAFLDYFSRSSSGLKYRVRNTSLLKRDWRLRQNADVLLFKYSNAYRPKDADGNDVWNGKSEDCDYIFSQDMAQRYADALMYQKRTEAVYYEFYADAAEDYPQGYPINSVVSLQGTDEDNPLMLITSRTDRNDPFGGYEYRAVPYDRKGVTLSESFVASNESLPASDEGLSMSISRELVDCLADGTPKDTTAIRITVTVTNRLFTPTLEIAGTAVDLTKVTEKVSTGDDTYEYVDTDDWIYDLDPTLGGADSCSVVAKAGTQSASRTIRKIVEGSDGAGTWFFKTTYTGTTAEIDALGESGGRSWERANLTGDDPQVKVGDSCYFGMTNTDTGRMDFVGGRCTTISTTAITCDEGLGVIRSGEDGAAGPQGPPGDKGDTGSQGYGIVAAVSRPSFTEANWNTYGTIGHEEVWIDTESIRSGCRIGDLFLVVGTATDTGTAHTLTYRSTTASGNLQGVCIAHSTVAKGDKGENGSDGTPAKVFSLTCDKNSVIRNDRLSSYSMDYTFTIEVQGYSGLVVVKVNGTEKTLSQSGTRYTLKYALPFKDAQALTVVAYLEGAEMARLELSVIDQTISNLFLGSQDSLPTKTDYGTLLDGDYFVASTTFTEDTKQYTEGYPYVYGNGSWLILDASTAENASKIMDCMTAVLNSDVQAPVDSPIYKWMQNFVAQNAVIANLFAKRIALVEAGEIASANYYDTPASMQRFRIKANGEAEFSGIAVKNAIIEGDSLFKGKIQSNSLTTTFESLEAGKTYNVGLGSLKYWKYGMLEKFLDGKNYSDGYISLSSSNMIGKQAVKMRKGSSPITLFHADESSEISTYTASMSQNITFKISVRNNEGSGYPTMVLIRKKNNDAFFVKGYSNPGSDEVSVAANKGDVFEIQIISLFDVNVYVVDSKNDFPNKYTFFDSSGSKLQIYGTYNQGEVSIDGATLSEYLYKPSGIPSENGSGECLSAKLTLVSEDGSINISNKSIFSVSWNDSSQLFFITTDTNRYSVSSDGYYKAFSASFTLKSSIDSVIADTILPKKSSTNIGDSDHRFNEAYINSIYGAIGDGSMMVVPNNNNEVNFGGTSSSNTIYFGYRAVGSKPIPATYVFGNGSATIKAGAVYGAVFN